MPRNTSAALGAAMFVLGLALGIGTYGHHNSDALAAAAVMVLGGVVAYAAGFVVEEVRRVNRPADEAWQDGYEIGHNRGWLDRDGELRKVVTPLRVLSQPQLFDTVRVEVAEPCADITHDPADNAATV